MSASITARRFALTTVLAAAVGLGGAGCAAAGSPSPDTDVDLLADVSAAPADTPSSRCTALQRWTALADVAPRVRDALANDPGLVAELDRTRGLPRDERRIELWDYVAGHPELTPQGLLARDALQQYRTTCAVR